MLLLLLPRLEASWLQHSCLTWPLLPMWLLQAGWPYTCAHVLRHLRRRHMRWCCLLRPGRLLRVRWPMWRSTKWIRRHALLLLPLYLLLLLLVRCMLSCRWLLVVRLRWRLPLHLLMKLDDASHPLLLPLAMKPLLVLVLLLVLHAASYPWLPPLLLPLHTLLLLLTVVGPLLLLLLGLLLLSVLCQLHEQLPQLKAHLASQCSVLVRTSGRCARTPGSDNSGTKQ
jgi:hypothetical protein